MAFSEWYPVKVDVGDRYADGKWRIEYNELITRIRVSSNGAAYSDLVSSGLDLDGYRAFAERVVAHLNKRH